MKSTLASIVVVVMVLSSRVFAQTPEDAVRQAQEAMFAAAAAGDKVAYQKLWADDLRWVTSEGDVIDKQERLRRVAPQPAIKRMADDVVIRRYGDIAVETARFTVTENGRSSSDRVLRVFVRRNGVWQLLAHEQVPLAPAQGR